MSPSSHEPPCSPLIEQEYQTKSIADRLDEVEAVIFGEGAAKSGGLKADIQAAKFWLRAVAAVLAIEAVLLGTDRIAAVFRLLK